MLEELMLIGTVLFWGFMLLITLYAYILVKGKDGDD